MLGRDAFIQLLSSRPRSKVGSTSLKQTIKPCLSDWPRRGVRSRHGSLEDVFWCTMYLTLDVFLFSLHLRMLSFDMYPGTDPYVPCT